MYQAMLLPPVETIFEDEDIVVRALAGDAGKPTLVTCGDFAWRSAKPGFWGSGPAAKMGWPAIGFAARRPNWFPAVSVAAATAVVRSRMGPVSIGYGYSMGAYGILKHGRRLGLTHGLALSPQLSISPEDLPHDPRYHPHYIPGIHAGMRVREEDLPEHAWAVFDPQHFHDAQNLALLESPRLHRVPTRGLYHGTVRLLTSQGRLEEALELLLRDDVAAFRRLLRGRRREEASWYAGMAAALLVRNRQKLSTTFLQRSRAMGLRPEDEAMVLGEALDAGCAAPDREKALRLEPLLEQLLTLPNQPPERHLTRSLHLAELGQLAASRQAAERGLAETGPHAGLMTHLGHLLLGMNELTEAARHLEEAVRLAPEDYWCWVGVAIARLRCGKAAAAEAAAREAARLQPPSFYPRLALGDALLACGKPAEAAEAFRVALALGGGKGAQTGLARAERAVGLAAGRLHSRASPPAALHSTAVRVKQSYDDVTLRCFPKIFRPCAWLLRLLKRAGAR
jgi:tetratricopeptide (TPR) repeat protein